MHDLVMKNGKPLDRAKGTTDVHLRGVPVLMPVMPARDCDEAW